MGAHARWLSSWAIQERVILGIPDDHVANIRIRHVAAFSASVGGSLEDPELSATLFEHSVEDVGKGGFIGRGPADSGQWPNRLLQQAVF